MPAQPARGRGRGRGFGPTRPSRGGGGMRLGHSVDEPAEKVEPAAAPPGDDTDNDEDDDMEGAGGAGPVPWWALAPHLGGLEGPPGQDSDDEMVCAGRRATVRGNLPCVTKAEGERPRQLIHACLCAS
jgi:hypothetical protein